MPTQDISIGNKDHRTCLRELCNGSNLARVATIVLLVLLVFGVPEANLLCSPIALSQPVRTAPSKLTPEQLRLIEAQTANQKAQAEYYLQQVQEQNDEKRPKSIWQKIAELLAGLGTFVAAIVALITFGLNYRATLRNQKDTQFYEALKRFGDPESPSVRSSAAGLLAQLGQHQGWSPRWLKTILGWLDRVRLPRRGPYYETALSQLLDGRLLEKNPVVISSIDEALAELVQAQPRLALNRLYNANLKIQKDAVKALADLLTANGVYHPKYITEEHLDKAAVEAHCDRGLPKAVTALAGFASEMNLSRQRTDMGTDETREAWRIAADRLRISAALCAMALLLARNSAYMSGAFLVDGWLLGADLRKTYLGSAHMEGANLYGARLQGTLLRWAKLRYANLACAQMQGSLLADADLSGAIMEDAQLDQAILHRTKLDGANLKNSKLNNTMLFSAEMRETLLEGANWWTADFSGCDVEARPGLRQLSAVKPTVSIDAKLLGDLYARYREQVPDDLGQLHPSVRSFVEQKRKEEEEARNPQT